MKNSKDIPNRLSIY